MSFLDNFGKIVGMEEEKWAWPDMGLTKIHKSGCGPHTSAKKKNLTHTGEKPFKCPESGCIFATARKSYLRCHVMKHTGEKL